ncbi:MAG: GtrA family protein [Bacteroidetes bacterium]|nr:GtrA family protein [Bacteroidota bacterium]
MQTPEKPTPFVSFLRYNLVATLATGVDFIALIALTELAGLWYMFSTISGAVFGALTAFLLGRYWVFVSKESKIGHQGFRYFLVASGSVVLNSSGVYLFTEIANLQYIISKVITAVLVAVCYNYLLSRYFVFR